MEETERRGLRGLHEEVNRTRRFSLGQSTAVDVRLCFGRRTHGRGAVEW